MTMTMITQANDTDATFSVASVSRYVEPVPPETTIEMIYARFSENPELRAIPVAKDGYPAGLISRYEFVDCLAQSNHPASSGTDPCTKIMNAAPLLVEISTPMQELSGFLSESDIRHFTDGYIITEQGRYMGIGTGQDLLRAITKAQVDTARYANPLTSLPGIVPITEHLGHMLQTGKSFSVCYVDLDNFKPFNDVCGYRKGDELIRFTASLLKNICDPTRDFIGHIGGDDFILVLQSPDWEQRCNRALSAYARTSSVMFDKEHRAIGGYMAGDRQGRVVHHPLPTLSIGAIRINPLFFNSHHEVCEAATSAKNMAKKKPGNSLFIERRRMQLHDMREPSPEHAGASYG